MRPSIILGDCLGDTKQVFQTRIDLFGAVPEPQPSAQPKEHPVVQMALAWMVPYAEKYCSGELQKEALVAASKKKQLELAKEAKLASRPKGKAEGRKRKPPASKAEEKATDPESHPGQPKKAAKKSTLEIMSELRKAPKVVFQKPERFE